jgi:hypothetical protein
MALGGKRPGAGRKPGVKAKIAEEFNALLAKKMKEQAEPLINALIAEALKGNVAALKELFERLLGKVPQQLADEAGNPVMPFQIVITRLHGQDRGKTI